MSWFPLSKIIDSFYKRNDLQDYLEEDLNYLTSAYYEIEKLWRKQLKEINEVKYVMLSEAPLWGETKNYIYNPNSINSSFFYRSNLSYALGRNTLNKLDFINKLNETGLLILDVSPFALNEYETVINFKSMEKKEYHNLLEPTIPLHLIPKLEKIKKLKSNKLIFFYRYKRVKDFFGENIQVILQDLNLININDNIPVISKQGGFIDNKKFKNAISKIF